jgi:hypothetical protein
MLQVIRDAPVHDVIVIGSGAGGGTVTKVLADLAVSVLRFHFAWTDAELKQAQHMQQTFREIIDAMGGTGMGRSVDPRELI